MQARTIVLAMIPLITFLIAGEGGSAMSNPLKVQNKNIPPIDRDINIKTETATFALG